MLLGDSSAASITTLAGSTCFSTTWCVYWSLQYRIRICIEFGAKKWWLYDTWQLNLQKSLSEASSV